MDKELNSIADDIIKDSFGSAAPSEAPSEPMTAPNEPMPSSRPQPSAAPTSPRPAATQDPFARATVSRDPFMNSRPATPRETFTAEIPTAEPASRPASMPAMGQKSRTNEYSRIKEQMSAAREASNLPDPSAIPTETNMPKHGLNKAIVFLIILIPIIVVSAGVIIALLTQPSTSDANESENANRPQQYVDPRATATLIDLSSYTEEIQITKAGHYLLTGTTTFPIKVNAPDEVTLYLDNISVTATDASALSNFSENLLVIVLDDGTENTLAVTDPETFTSIYSDGDLTIDGGTGVLNVSGIKIADGRHYDVTGSGINDTKGAIIEPQTAEPTDQTPAETTEPPAEPSSVEGQPTEPVDPVAPAGPAEN